MSITQLLDFRHTRIAPTRPLTSYGKVRALIGTARRNRRWQLTPDLLAKHLLDIGCGSNTHPEFINMDYLWSPGVDLVWDILTGAPFKDRSLYGIFTEHCLEHFPIEVTERILIEAHRILMPGCIIRVVVPSLDLYLSAYRSGAGAPYAEYDALHGLYTPAMSLNRIMRKYDHQFIYDVDTLKALLERIGFHRVAECAFGQGRNPRLLKDSPSRAVESLYVEAARA